MLLDPRLVPLDDGGLPASFDYVKYSAVYLTRAIQQLAARVVALEAK